MKYITVLSLFILVVAVSGCYYDNEAELYPNNTCDTINVTYNSQIKTILNANCTTCHSGGSPAAGISLDNYNDAKTQATNGNLYGVVSYSTGYTGMPASGKMNDCNIALIKKWVDSGAPQN